MNRPINKFSVAAVVFAVVAMLMLNGCSQQKQQPAATQQPQVQEAPITPAETQPQQPQLAQAPQQEADPDVYKDNLNQSIDELSQLDS